MLEQADRVVRVAEAVRLQVMLAGLDAMILEETASGGPLEPDDPVLRGFFLHQANVLRTTRYDVERRLEAARLLRDHLPETWAVFLDGRASERAVVTAAAQAIGLGGPHFAAFDAVAARLVQSERTSAIERTLIRLRDRLDPAVTIERQVTASNRRWVRARPEADGQGVLEIHSTATDIAAAYDRIRSHAVTAHTRDGECRTLGALMVDGAIDAILTGTMRGPEQGGPSYPLERLGHPGDAGDPGRTLIDATILVTVPGTTATGAADGPADVAGMGTIDAETARTIVAHTRAWTRVLTDPIDDAVLGIDSSERYIPTGLKRLLHLRQPTCGCGCGLPAHRADIDHIVRYEHDGRTRHDNLQILCRASHQAKDAGHLDVAMRPDGTIRWRDKWGGVTHVEPAMRIRTSSLPDEPPF